MSKNYEEENKISHASVRFHGGTIVMPVGFEDYYLAAWRWKVNMGIPIEKEKLEYLLNYERINGKITHRRKLNGEMIPMPAAKSVNQK